jgi:hypothetical protein
MDSDVLFRLPATVSPQQCCLLFTAVLLPLFFEVKAAYKKQLNLKFRKVDHKSANVIILKQFKFY